MVVEHQRKVTNSLVERRSRSRGLEHGWMAAQVWSDTRKGKERRQGRERKKGKEGQQATIKRHIEKQEKDCILVIIFELNIYVENVLLIVFLNIIRCSP